MGEDVGAMSLIDFVGWLDNRKVSGVVFVSSLIVCAFWCLLYTSHVL